MKEIKFPTRDFSPPIIPNGDMCHEFCPWLKGYDEDAERSNRCMLFKEKLGMTDIIVCNKQLQHTRCKQCTDVSGNVEKLESILNGKSTDFFATQ